MNTSPSGIALIKKFEGFKPAPYLCPAGYPTIGYGHRLLPGETFTTISEIQATAILYKDVAVAEKAIERLAKVSLTQGQYDALVDFIFNLGVTAFAKSTLLKRLNEGNYQAAADNFQRWVYSKNEKLPGLIRRRTAEWALFTGKEANHA
jgi:lysozyme